MENLPASITEDHLRLYFESAKNGNGIVSSVELTSEHDAAVISFENSAGIFASWKIMMN